MQLFIKSTMQILALLLGGTICLVPLVKNQNDPIRTEGGVVC